MNSTRPTRERERERAASQAHKMTTRPSQNQGQSPAHSDAILDLAPAATAIGLVFAVLVGYEIP